MDRNFLEAEKRFLDPDSTPTWRYGATKKSSCSEEAEQEPAVKSAYEIHIKSNTNAEDCQDER